MYSIIHSFNLCLDLEKPLFPVGFPSKPDESGDEEIILKIWNIIKPQAQGAVLSHPSHKAKKSDMA